MQKLPNIYQGKPQIRSDSANRHNQNKTINQYEIALTKNMLFPLLIPNKTDHKIHSKEHLTKCFMKALENIGYKGRIENIDRFILKKVFIEFGIMIQNWQLTECYFFATFDSKNEITIGNSGNKTKNKELIEKLTSNTISNINNEEDDDNDNKDTIRNNVFNLENFISWFQKAMLKMRNYTVSEMEQLKKFNGLGGAGIALTKPKRAQNRWLNQSMDNSIDRESNRGLSSSSMANCLPTTNNYYKELYNLLEKKRMFKMEHPDIDITKKPNFVKKIRGKETKSIESSPDEYNVKKISGNQFKVLEMDECNNDPRMEQFKVLQQIDEKIKILIKKCFQSFLHESPKTKKSIFNHIKLMHSNKLQENENNGELYSDITKYRIEYNQQMNKLKAYEELILLMKEQDSVLEATRLYDMLYINNEEVQDDIKKMNALKRVKGDDEFKLQNLLRMKLT